NTTTPATATTLTQPDGEAYITTASPTAPPTTPPAHPPTATPPSHPKPPSTPEITYTEEPPSSTIQYPFPPTHYPYPTTHYPSASTPSTLPGDTPPPTTDEGLPTPPTIRESEATPSATSAVTDVRPTLPTVEGERETDTSVPTLTPLPTLPL
ncbi:hypothetical protein OTU49_017434, partial [Cherax quadricarinatus]